MNTSPSQSLFSKSIRFLAFLTWSEFQHRLHQIFELGFTPKLLMKAYAVLEQKYYGDITIVPNIPFSYYLHLVGNPTDDMVARYTVLGEQATWPKLSIIKNHCQIELMVDDLTNKLK